MMELFLEDERTKASQACKGAFTILSFGMGVGDEAGVGSISCSFSEFFLLGFSFGTASATSVLVGILLDRWCEGISVYTLLGSDIMAEAHKGVGSSLSEATA